MIFTPDAFPCHTQFDEWVHCLLKVFLLVTSLWSLERINGISYDLFSPMFLQLNLDGLEPMDDNEALRPPWAFYEGSKLRGWDEP